MMRIFVAVVILLYASTLWCQVSTKDSLLTVLKTDQAPGDRAATLHALGPRYISSNPDSALLLAEQAFSITADMDDYEIHSRSYRRMGHALYVVGDWDRFRKTLLDYAAFAEANGDYFQVAASYRNLSKIGEAQKLPDSSLYYLEKCLEVLEEHPDTIIMIDVHLSKGLTYKYKGFYEMSIAALLDGLRLSESMEKPYKLGYLHMNIAITYNAMGRDEESLYHIKKSIPYFEEDDNDRAVTRSLGNLGFAYKALDSVSASNQAFQKAVESANATAMPNIAMHSLVGLADIAFEKEDYPGCLSYLDQAEDIAKEIGHQFTLGAISRFRAKVALRQNNRAQARAYLGQAEKRLLAYRDPIEEGETYFEMASLYEDLGFFQQSVTYLKKGHALEDSVYTLKKEQQFAELELTYETEKKDAQILLLNKQTQLDATRKRGLWIALGLLALLGVSIIYALIQRKRKKEAILIKEKEAETKKLELANQELEFKKKELTAKALQLARKNEFLIGLESEIDDLKSSVDKTVGKTSERITRMIQMDANDDDEWAQFGKEFSSVHQDFLDRLKEKYGSFSKSEMRLIALLKMNMSSKDIANTLRISPEGIKKARYRLRKKMGLESEVDLQGHLIGF